MNKTFLITGASAGLGEIFSISIADIAKNIIIVGRNKNRLLRLKKKINKINSKIKVLIVIVDLSKESGVFKLFKQFETQKKNKICGCFSKFCCKFYNKKNRKNFNATIKERFSIKCYLSIYDFQIFWIKNEKKD